MKVTLAVCAVIPIIATSFKYYVLGLNDESFPDFSMMYGIKYGKLIDQSLKFVKIYEIFCSWRWPFNDKTPIGFLFASFFGDAGSFSIIIVYLSAISLLLGSCWLFISFAEDIENDLNVLNIRRRSSRSSTQMKQHLCDIVKVYSDVQELSIEILISKYSQFNCKFISELSVNLMQFMSSLFLPSFYGLC